MIEEISISGMGVIDQARVAFGPGLTAVTGETGAGKSMLLQSLGLLMGQRSDPAKVRHGHDRCIVDGIFDAAASAEVRDIVDGAGGIIDEDGLIYLSRQVPASGRSRAFVSGRPVPAGVLAKLADFLVTVHGQSDQVRLVAARSQRDFLDSYGQAPLQKAKQAYRQAFDQWNDAVAAQQRWEEEAESRREEAARLRQGLDAFDAAQPFEDEDEILARSIERQMNSDNLRADISAAIEALSSSDMGGGQSFDVVSLLVQARQHVESAQDMDPVFEETVAELANVDYIVQDIVGTLSDYVAQLDVDPRQLEADHYRLAQLKELCAGRAEDVNGVIAWARQARERLDELDHPDNSAEAWQERVDEAYGTMMDRGRDLTRIRTRAARKLAECANREIHELSMPDAKLDIVLRPTDKPMSYGMEEAAFLLRPHEAADSQPLGKVASGGELSRIMLALEVCHIDAQSSLKADMCPTLVFDEIDAGIGGQTAKVVAKRLGQLAASRQVIVVTHLPQVAAEAGTHLVVRKNGGTTEVRQLTDEERQQEIARMLSGEDTLDAALRHAEELLVQAHTG